MVVQELIDELKKYPKDTPVVVAGYRGGTNLLRITDIYQGFVDTSAGLSEFFGEYGGLELSTSGMETPLKVLLLDRNEYAKN